MSILDNEIFSGENVPNIKLGLHLFQIVLAFVVFCLEIAVFHNSDAKINGRNGWTFAVVFLSIPAWIYLIMAPRYPRTQRFAGPAAMICVDALFMVIWLSAFSTQAAYNTANSCGGACGVSKAIVGMGFFAFLAWAATTFLSLFTLKYYEANTALPGYGRISARKQQPVTSDIDPDKAAFSTAPHDEEYARLDMEDRDEGHHDDNHVGGVPSPYGAPTGAYGSGAPHLNMADPYAPNPSHLGAADPFGTTTSQVSYNSNPSSAGENPFRQDNPFDNETEYSGAGHFNQPSEYGSHPTQPASFPTANYER